MIGHMRGGAESVRDARVLAGWALGASALLAGPLALSAVGWLRDGLRYGCWYETQGEGAGSWTCGDGLVLLSAGVPMLVLCALALAVALVCVLLAARAPRALLPIAALMAGVPTIATCLLLLGPARATDAAIAQSGGIPPARSALDLWTGCVRRAGE